MRRTRAIHVSVTPTRAGSSKKMKDERRFCKVLSLTPHHGTPFTHYSGFLPPLACGRQLSVSPFCESFFHSNGDIHVKNIQEEDVMIVLTRDAFTWLAKMYEKVRIGS